MAGARGMTVCHSWGKAVGGPGDPRNPPQLALGSPFKCFQLWRGVRGTLHCKPLKKNETKLWGEKNRKKPTGPEWLSGAWRQIWGRKAGEGKRGRLAL